MFSVNSEHYGYCKFDWKPIIYAPFVTMIIHILCEFNFLILGFLQLAKIEKFFRGFVAKSKSS